MQTTWYENFYILKEYLVNNNLTIKEITGKTEIKGRKIGKWLMHQCDKYIDQTILSEDQRALLESINIQEKTNSLIEKRKNASPRRPIIYKGTWDDKYEIAKREVNKGLEIKREYVTEEGFSLGMWIKSQRSAFKNKKLTKEKADKLHRLGLLDNIRPDYLSWDEWFAICLQVKNELGTINVPVAYKYKDKSIGTWLQLQRLYSKKLSDEQKSKLNELGFIWGKRGYQISMPEYIVYFYIKKQFEDTISQYENNGYSLDIFIPQHNIGIEYDGFYHISKEKRDKNKNISCKKDDIFLIRLREDRLNKTTGIQSTSKVINIKDRVRPENSFIALEPAIKELFKIIKSRFKIDVSPDINIERDLQEISNEYVRFNTSLYVEKYSALKKYAKNNNVAEIGKHTIFDGVPLYPIVFYFRRAKVTNSLSELQIKELEEIGFVWDKLDYNWEEYYSLVSEYIKFNKASINDIKHKTSYKGKKIGSWISKQRYAKNHPDVPNKISEEQIKKLEALGINWDNKTLDDIAERNLSLLQSISKTKDINTLSFNSRINKIDVGKWLARYKDRYFSTGRKNETQTIFQLELLGVEWEPECPALLTHKSEIVELIEDNVDFWNDSFLLRNKLSLKELLMLYLENMKDISKENKKIIKEIASLINNYYKKQLIYA